MKNFYLLVLLLCIPHAVHTSYKVDLPYYTAELFAQMLALEGACETLEHNLKNKLTVSLEHIINLECEKRRLIEKGLKIACLREELNLLSIMMPQIKYSPNRPVVYAQIREILNHCSPGIVNWTNTSAVPCIFADVFAWLGQAVQYQAAQLTYEDEKFIGALIHHYDGNAQDWFDKLEKRPRNDQNSYPYKNRKLRQFMLTVLKPIKCIHYARGLICEQNTCK
jgi:hypothetical protein